MTAVGGWYQWERPHSSTGLVVTTEIVGFLAGSMTLLIGGDLRTRESGSGASMMQGCLSGRALSVGDATHRGKALPLTEPVRRGKLYADVSRETRTWAAEWGCRGRPGAGDAFNTDLDANPGPRTRSDPVDATVRPWRRRACHSHALNPPHCALRGAQCTAWSSSRLVPDTTDGLTRPKRGITNNWGPVRTPVQGIACLRAQERRTATMKVRFT